MANICEKFIEFVNSDIRRIIFIDKNQLRDGWGKIKI